MGNFLTKKGQRSLVSGVAETVANIKGLEYRVTGDNVKRSILMPAAEILFEEVKRRAPVRTGKLLSAAFMSKGKSNVSYVAVGIILRKVKNITKTGRWKEAWYAKDVEYGTSKWMGKPYFRPAVAAKKEKVIQMLKDGFRRELERIAS